MITYTLEELLYMLDGNGLIVVDWELITESLDGVGLTLENGVEIEDDGKGW